MENKKLAGLIVTISICVLLAACAAIEESGYTPPPRHPEEEGENLRFCTDCHDTEEAPIPYEKFEHGIFFANNHNQVAGRYGSVCATCHRQSYCTDCHGMEVELRPSIKNQTENYRRMPHRGDYLSRHAIDGRINPASCYRCHGNPKSSRSCVACHG